MAALAAGASDTAERVGAVVCLVCLRRRAVIVQAIFLHIRYGFSRLGLIYGTYVELDKFLVKAMLTASVQRYGTIVAGEIGDVEHVPRRLLFCKIGY